MKLTLRILWLTWRSCKFFFDSLILLVSSILLFATDIIGTNHSQNEKWAEFEFSPLYLSKFLLSIDLANEILV
jgi:hypothetical protein